MIFEIAYADGSIYKESGTNDRYKTIRSFNKNTKIKSVYYQNTGNIYSEDCGYDYYCIKEDESGHKTLKMYTPSLQSYELIKRTPRNYDDLSKYDLCPSVGFWVGSAHYLNNENYSELIFNVVDDNNLNEISEYYNLPWPLPNNINIDSNPKEWISTGMVHFKELCDGYGEDITEEEESIADEIIFGLKFGAIIFDKGVPKILKMYKSNHFDRNYRKV